MIKLLLMLLISTQAMAHNYQMYSTHGFSRSQQYVAVEIYGQRIHDQSSYVTIKIMDLWSKKYVGKPIEVKLPGTAPEILVKARQQAKLLATGELNKFKISG